MKWTTERICDLIGYAAYVQKCIEEKEMPVMYEQWKEIVKDLK